MRQFFRYLRALVRHSASVMVSIIASALLASPIWLRPSMSPEWQGRLDSMLTFDVDSLRKAYLFFIPLGLFWTSYRAWKGENDAKIKAERSTPAALSLEVSQLREQLEPRQLTEKHAAILKKAFKEINVDWSVQLSFNPNNTEAAHYAQQFWERLRGLVFLNATNDVPIDLRGVWVSVKNLANIPERGHMLSAALASAGVKHSFMASPWRNLEPQRDARDDYCDVIIGKKPLE